MKLKDLCGKESEFHSLIPMFNQDNQQVDEIWIKVRFKHDEKRGFPLIKHIESQDEQLLEFIQSDDGADIRKAIVEDMYELLNA